MYKQFQNLQSIEEQFIQNLQNEKNRGMIDQNLWQNNLKMKYNELTQQSLQLLRDGSIRENEISSLLNIYRELYSSHKALLIALTEMHAKNNDITLK
jgi:hypothetical protein